MHARGISAHAPGLTLLTDGTHADVGQTGAGQDSDATEAVETPGGSAEVDLGNVAIGSITLSAALWSILCDEAEQNVAILQHEVSLMQFDPDHPPIAAMVRASHTLCGIHRTGGIAVIAEVAQSLELTLLALEQHGSPFPGGAHPVLARASAGLAHLVGRVRAREAFSAGDEREGADIGVELDELRQEAAANAPALDLLLGDDDLDRGAIGPDSGAAAGDESPAESGSAIAEAAVAAESAGAAEIAGAAESNATAESDVATGSEAPAALAATAESADWGPGAGELEAATEARIGAAAAVSSDMWSPSTQFAPAPPLAPAIPSDETLLDVTDDVDEQVVPIFLEEAAELFPRAGSDLRDWRREPRG